MFPSKRQSNLGVHSTVYLVLLFTYGALSAKLPSSGCIEKTYSVVLVNETTNANDPSLMTKLDEIIPGNCNSSSIKLIGPLTSNGFIADLLIASNDGFEAFETRLLEGVKYGSENKTMIPHSRVFSVKFNVSDPNSNETFLEDVIKKIFGGDPVIATLLESNSHSRVMRLWLHINSSHYPNDALRPLSEAIQNGSSNGLTFQQGSFKAFTVYPSPTSKDFRVEFQYSLSIECDSALLSNTSSKEYHSLVDEIKSNLNTNHSSLQEHDGIEITHLECSTVSRAASSNVNVIALLKLSKSSGVTPQGVGEALLTCTSSSSKVSNLRITLLNPLTFEDETEAMIICSSTTTTQPDAQSTQPTNQKTNQPTNQPSTASPTLGKTPRVFLRLRLAITWSQFCGKLEDSLKHNIAKNIYDKNGNVVSSNRVVFINSVKNCADPLKTDEQVDLWFYISDKAGSTRPSPCVTLKAQRVLRMMINNGNTKMLGSDFAGKVISANLAGCDANKIDKKDKDVDWTLVLIIIAVIVGAALLLLACCCICCGAARRRRSRRYKDKQMELVIVDNAYVQANGDGEQVNGEGGKENSRKNNGKHGKNEKHGKATNHGRKGGRAIGEAKDDDSDEYYDCCGGGVGKKSKRDGKKEKINDKSSKSNGDQGDGKADGDANKNNNENKQDVVCYSNEGYEELRGDKSSGQDNEPPLSYQSLQYGLGDRKPSAESSYATIGDQNKRPSQDMYVNIYGTNGGPVVDGATAGLLAGSMNDNKRGSLPPAIVTSPAPDTGAPLYSNTSTPSNDRRGSASRTPPGSPGNSKLASGNSLSNVDDEQLRERRRLSIHSLMDDDAEPLKHKTATVGIVGLALRNKNERKKETEFKNLDKEMPPLGTYPANTAGKNRHPEILPKPRSRVKLSSSPDYINASYLHNHKGQRHYIATQHPLVETNHDFWQMVWDQGSHLIVMVNDDENSKQIEYPKYWPTTEGSSLDSHGILVTNKQVDTKADYVITTLLITNTKTKPSTTREVAHYRFTSWKDKDQVPNVAMFVGFVVATREVSRKHEDENSPVIVHCCDGQGFTGVFVALDIGIRSHEESKTSVVDLFELAKRLRQGRSGIINSIQLYNFAYQCLYEYTVNYDEEAEKKKDA